MTSKLTTVKSASVLFADVLSDLMKAWATTLLEFYPATMSKQTVTQWLSILFARMWSYQTYSSCIADMCITAGVWSSGLRLGGDVQSARRTLER
jgi:hypothetical protein